MGPRPAVRSRLWEYSETKINTASPTRGGCEGLQIGPDGRARTRQLASSSLGRVSGLVEPPGGEDPEVLDGVDQPAVHLHLLARTGLSSSNMSSHVVISV